MATKILVAFTTLFVGAVIVWYATDIIASKSDWWFIGCFVLFGVGWGFVEVANYLLKPKK